MQLTIAVPAEPLPRTPQGRSAALKLDDWLTLAHQWPEAALRVESANELSGPPDLVESFLPEAHLLSAQTIPSRKEHDFLEDIRAYWPSVMKSGIPAIPVLPAGQQPERFPVFVRGRSSSLRGSAPIRSAAQLPRLTADVIVRPWMEIERCDQRSVVTKEMRAHVVYGEVCAVEFLFPSWASQHPTPVEMTAGLHWARSESTAVRGYAQKLADQLPGYWFCADFAQTTEGLLLIEVNAGWCSGITHPSIARAVHLTVLKRAFQRSIPETLWISAGVTAVWVADRR